MRVSALTLAALLAGCQADLSADPSAGLLPQDQLAPSQTLVLTMDELIPGQAVNISVTGANPGDRVRVAATRGGIQAGGGACPAAFGGACLDILPDPVSGSYNLVLNKVANASGAATWTVPSFPNVADADWYFQAAVVAGANTNLSNALYRPVRTCQPDAAEENDTQATAFDVPAPGSYPGLTSCSGDDDWYRFRVQDGESFRLDVLFSDEDDGDVDVTLVSATGTQLDGSFSTSDNETVEWQNTTGAAAFISARVYLFADSASNPPATGGNRGAPYDLQVTQGLPSPCVDDALEDNDDALSASTGVSGSTVSATSCTADSDYYAFTAVAGDVISVSAVGAVGEGTLAVRIFDDLGTELATDTSAPYEPSFVTTADGTYYVVVDLGTDDAFGGGVPYDLTVTVAPPAPCVTDAFEPNDDALSATPISAGTPALTAESCTTDDDYYSFTGQAGDVVDAAVIFNTLGGDQDVDMELLDSSGTVLATANFNFTSPDPLSATLPADGTYYLRVYLSLDDAAGGGAAYDLDLTITTPAPCPADGFEPNDDAVSATPITPGVPAVSANGCILDDDFYSFTASAGDIVDAAVVFATLGGDQDVDMELLDSAGNQLALADFNFTSPDPLSATVPADGTYYLRVYTSADDAAGGGVAYDLNLEVTTPAPCVDDALEDNDDALSATAYTAGTTVTAQSCVADSDWYAIPVLAGDVVAVAPTFDTADGQIDLYVFDDAGNQLAADTFAPLNAQATAPADGFIYAEIRFQSDDSAGGGVAYDFVANVLGSCAPDAYEPNEDIASAFPVSSFPVTGGQTCDTNDEDFFAFSLLAGDAVTVTTTFIDAEGDVDMRVFDPAGTQLGGGFSVTDNETYTFTAAADGTYFVHVYLFADAGTAVIGNTYDLDVTIAP